MSRKKLSAKLAVRDELDLSQRVLQSLRRQEMVRSGERVGVAVSGGADSVALLLLLMELREKLGIVLGVVHFNHKLRGRASDADERLVTKLASRLSLGFYVHRADVAHLAKRSRRNLEDAARGARYAWFERIAEEQHLTRIATAHTADDQAETVLAHLLRGTGIAGLAGIHPVAGKVIRPFLGVRRRELRTYLKKRRQTWREDVTNRDITRTRARLRLKLIPLLEKQFQPLAVEHLAALATRARENEELLSALSDQVCRSLVSSDASGLRIRVQDLLVPWKLERPAGLRALSSRLVLDLAMRVKPGSGQLTAAHVCSVLRLAEKGEPGKVLQLPGGLRIRREHDALLFCAADGEAFSLPSRPRTAAPWR